MNTPDQNPKRGLGPKTGLDRTGRRAVSSLVAGFVLLVVVVVISSVAGLGWLPWLAQRSWLLILVLVLLVLPLLIVFDMTRAKNVAWRSLRERFGSGFDESLDRKNFGTGGAKLGDFGYLGVRCFGSPGGLEIGRILSIVNAPLQIPWSAMAKIDTYPNLLTGRRGFETDMQARITLRDAADFEIEVPWLTEYRQLLPKSVKYRSIKLSKK